MAIQDPLTEIIIGCCFQVANELGHGVNVGNPEADLLVEGRARVEVKAVSAPGNADVAQGLTCRRGTGLVTCLLVNFVRARIQVRRLGMTRAAATGDADG